MQKLIETLKEFGIEVPAEKQADVKKALSEHYKNAAEHNKTISKLEADRDKWKTQAETAEETLKSFEGIDPEKIQSELVEWKKKAEEAERKAKDEIYNRDFADALKTELENIKFTSEAARKAVMAEVKDAKLSLRDGKILGLSDLIEQIRKSDPAAFVNEQVQKPEIFGNGQPVNRPGAPLTRKDIDAIKDAKERQALIDENRHLYVKQ